MLHFAATTGAISFPSCVPPTNTASGFSSFTNSTKTAAKWGIKIRLTLTKNEGYEGEVAIYGFGGAFE